MDRIVVLAGGVGGAAFVRGLRRAVAGTGTAITGICNVGDDMWLTGLRVCPDLDSMMYALAGVNDRTRGWGRAGESERVAGELSAFGAGVDWFTLGDLDLATHVARTALLREGRPLSEVTQRLCGRWDLGVHLLPVTDDEMETRVEIATEGATRTMHFEEWWVRHRAALPVRRFVSSNAAAARPAPGVLEALDGADAVLLAPSNPVVSIGTLLAVPGMRDAVRAARGRVVGVSPIIGGSVVRGMGDVCLRAIGVDVEAAGVARHYGARVRGGLLDAWLVDLADEAAVEPLGRDGIVTAAVPLWMRDDEATAAIARHALVLAGRPGRG